MIMPVALARLEMTTGERCEHLLGVIACTLTGKRPHEFMPWVRSGLDEFAREVGRG
ncbi:MAG: hypothetical protein RLZZ36_521 [Pseudomonadota bacterium]|jgi:hypothetical protein